MAEVTETNPKGAGAPEGNSNSSKNNRLWAETIKRAVIQSDGVKLRAIAEALIEKAAEGDIQAIKELGDRLDGKPAQVIASDEERPFRIVQTVELVALESDENSGSDPA